MRLVVFTGLVGDCGPTQIHPFVGFVTSLHCYWRWQRCSEHVVGRYRRDHEADKQTADPGRQVPC